jgi:hypothetical protein
MAVSHNAIKMTTSQHRAAVLYAGARSRTFPAARKTGFCCSVWNPTTGELERATNSEAAALLDAFVLPFVRLAFGAMVHRLLSLGACYVVAMALGGLWLSFTLYWDLSTSFALKEFRKCEHLTPSANGLFAHPLPMRK